MRIAEDFVVSLDRFEGPLDLLLYLIRKNEVGIEDIPIAPITDQYLAHLRGLERIDVDTAAEFLVMAATLMEIKSRLIAPPPEGESSENQSDHERARRPGDEADPRAELILQLLAYRQYRDAADALDTRRTEWERRFPAAKAGIDKDALRQAQHTEADDIDPDDIDLLDLVRAFARIAESVNFDRIALGAHEIGSEETPIELHAEDLLERLRGPRESSRTSTAVSLRDAATGKSKPEIIGLFLALLELMKCGVVSVKTLPDASDVMIDLKPEIARDPALLSSPASELLARSVNAPVPGDTPPAKPDAWDEDDEFAGDEDDDDDDLT
ncbi:MAG: segregation/condensation protein A [Phycisphaeraceae bacterium]|nr:segregation/condensation protein A [Phycisphaeraceae bacterium]